MQITLTTVISEEEKLQQLLSTGFITETDYLKRISDTHDIRSFSTIGFYDNDGGDDGDDTDPFEIPINDYTLKEDLLPIPDELDSPVPKIQSNGFNGSDIDDFYFKSNESLFKSGFIGYSDFTLLNKHIANTKNDEYSEDGAEDTTFSLSDTHEASSSEYEIPLESTESTAMDQPEAELLDIHMYNYNENNENNEYNENNENNEVDIHSTFEKTEHITLETGDIPKYPIKIKKYGKIIFGVVWYINSREGSYQSPLLEQPVTFRSIIEQYKHQFNLNHRQPPDEYYLENIWDKNKKIYFDNYNNNNDESEIPNGQYHLKIKKTTFQSANRTSIVSGNSKMDWPSLSSEMNYSESFKTNLHPKHYTYTSPESLLKSVLFTTCYLPNPSNRNSPAIYDEINSDVSLGSVGVLYGGRYFSFGITDIKSIGERLNLSSFTLEDTQSKEIINDDRRLRSGTYRVIVKHHHNYRAPNSFRVIKTKYDPYSPLDFPLYFSEFDPVPMHFTHHSPFTVNIIKPTMDENRMLKAMENYGNKHTKKRVLKLHFFARTRYIQEKYKSIGNISDRLEKRLCIITGLPLLEEDYQESEHHHMYPKFYDEKIGEMIKEMKSGDGHIWKDLFEYPESQHEKLMSQIEQKKLSFYEPDEREPPICRTGDVNSKKFSYGIDAKSIEQVKIPWIKSLFTNPKD
eukprot:TRINITY_DN7801_c0_g1_i1.p1 TRINITY_DN7801_c0_g1~~TRINITY_DN7801_c0_g1_i1.p1  ORF type:complete len:685 (-),score=139.16 TRINITY_DN7801_c0_g1_i1:39-2093(-)